MFAQNFLRILIFLSVLFSIFNFSMAAEDKQTLAVIGFINLGNKPDNDINLSSASP